MTIVPSGQLPSRLGVLGHPVSHSLSPVFQQAALDALGIPLRYERFDVAPDLLVERLREMVATGWAGNVTIPHKEILAAQCTRLTAVATRLGAVNTVWQTTTGELVGHNTDVDGVRATLMALGVIGQTGTAVVIGAGGAASAVCAELRSGTDLEVHLLTRTPERARTLLSRLGMDGKVHRIVEHPDDSLLRQVADAAIIVNASPIGQRDDHHPFPLSHVAPQTRLFDLVYRPEGTSWIREANRRGIHAEDGLRMLVEQGAAAFTCWFGSEPPRDVMWRALGLELPPPDAPRPLASAVN